MSGPRPDPPAVEAAADGSVPPFPMQRDEMQVAVTRFRRRLQLAILLVVVLATGSVLALSHLRMAADAEADFQREFRRAFEMLRVVHELRQGALSERSHDLIAKVQREAGPAAGTKVSPYLSTQEVMHEIMGEESDTTPDSSEEVFHAEFYRFLDRRGHLIEPEAGIKAGHLTPGELRQLELPEASLGRLQFGYLRREQKDSDGPLYETIAVPIPPRSASDRVSTLVLGFESAERVLRPAPGVLTGVWIGGRIYQLDLPEDAAEQATAFVNQVLAHGSHEASPGICRVRGASYRLFIRRLNPASAFPPAYEVGLYPLSQLQERQAHLRWLALGVGGLLLAAGLVASSTLAARFARPVETMALSTADYRARRQVAEAAYRQAEEGLRRAARFSADASHQLKTPVAVLRAGLEELAAKPGLPSGAGEEVGELVRQTDRIRGVIEDLLLLSRMDEGRLRLDQRPVNLAQLLAAALDDRSIRPDPFLLTVKLESPDPLLVQGDPRYLALLLQNLVENAGKYNRAGGEIRLSARRDGAEVRLVVANTSGQPIPPEAWEQIFDRFHRGAVGENIPGYGLGLNLAREIARLHQGSLRLLRSDQEWTEFQLCLPAALPE